MIFTWSVTTVNRFTNIYDEGVAQVRAVTYIKAERGAIAGSSFAKLQKRRTIGHGRFDFFW